MKLIHKGKTSRNEIPLDTERAMQSAAFATISTKRGGVVTHEGVHWALYSTQQGEGGKRAKYEENVFILVFDDPAQIDRVIGALQVAKTRFETPEIPGDVSTAGLVVEDTDA